MRYNYTGRAMRYANPHTGRDTVPRSRIRRRRKKHYSAAEMMVGILILAVIVVIKLGVGLAI